MRGHLIKLIKMATFGETRDVAALRSIIQRRCFFLERIFSTALGEFSALRGRGKEEPVALTTKTIRPVFGQQQKKGSGLTFLWHLTSSSRQNSSTFSHTGQWERSPTVVRALLGFPHTHFPAVYRN
jgi:hypothetical protein